MFDLNAVQSAIRELGFDAWLFYDFRGSNALARSILKLEGGMNTRRFLYLVPALVLICGVDVKRAIGTSLLIITINSLGGFLGFAWHEAIPWRLAFTVAAFNAAGSLLGERLGKPLPAHRLRPAFGVFLLVLGAAMVVENVVDLFSKTH